MLLSAISWTGSGDGTNWSDRFNWNTQVLPGASDDVTINVAGGATVNFDLLSPNTIHGLSSNADLVFASGVLTVSTLATFTHSATLNGGTIAGGTWSFATGTALQASNISSGIDGITLAGNLLVPDGASLIVKNGLTLNSATVTLAGSSSFANIQFLGTQTLGGNGQVLFTGGSSSDALVGGGDGTPTGAATLTIGAGIAIQANQSGSIFNSFNYDSIVNQGVITVDGSGAFLSIGSGASVVNNGTIQALNGATLYFNAPLTLGAASTLHSSADSSIFFTGDTLGGPTNPAQFSLAGLTYSPITTNAATLEVMSSDQGNILTGLSNNFAYGSLLVNTTGTLQLVDLTDNAAGAGAEALYCDQLIVASGSTLDLNGLHLYTRSAQINGSVIGGTVSLLTSAGVLEPLNTTLAGDQFYPASATSSAGTSVVAWRSNPFSSTSAPEVYARLLDSTGLPLSGEILVASNSGQFSQDDTLGVAMDDAGNFVVAWQIGQASSASIVAQRFDASGQSVGSLLTLNSATVADELDGLAMDGNGNFAAIWGSALPSSVAGSFDPVGDLYVRLFNPDGTPKGAEFKASRNAVNSAGHFSFAQSGSLAMAGNGAFAVAYSRLNFVGSDLSLLDNDTPVSQDVVFQRYDAAGVPQGAEQVVFQNTSALTPIDGTGIVMDSRGNFGVGWQVDRKSSSQTLLGSSIFFRRYSAAGVAVGSTITAITASSGIELNHVDVSLGESGDVVFTWSTFNSSTSAEQFYYRRFLNGVAETTTPQSIDPANTYSNDDVTVAVRPDGDFLLAWSGQITGLPDSDVYAKVFTPAKPNLQIAIEQVTLAPIFVAGDKGSVKVRLTNTGQVGYAGPGTVRIALAADANDNGSLDPGELPSITLATLADVALNVPLNPTGQALTANFTVSSDIPTGKYFIVAQVDPDNLIPEVSENDNSANTTGAYEARLAFGMVDTRTGVNLVVTQPGPGGNTIVTFGLRGAGSGTVTNSNGLLNLTLNDTNITSTIIITTKPGSPTAGNTILLGDILVGSGLGAAPLAMAMVPGAITAAATTPSAGLGKFLAKTAKLVGNANFTQGIGQLTFGQTGDGATITIAASADPTATTTLNILGPVRNLSVDSAMRIKSLSAVEWIDDDGTPDVISAPSIGSLAIKGSKLFGLPGDFQADLDLTRAGGLPQRLGAVKVAGSISDATWNVDGDIANMQVGQNATNWNLTTTNPTKGLTGAKVGGALSNSTWNLAGNVGNLAIAGAIDTWSLTAGGAIKGIRTLSASGLALIADSAGALTIGGNLANSSLTLNHPFAVDDKVAALNKLTITGSANGLVLRAAGNVGSISADSLTGSKLFVGVLSSIDNLPANAGDLSGAGDDLGPLVGSLTVKTALNSSLIGARAIGKLLLPTPDGAETPSGVAAQRLKTATIGTVKGLDQDKDGSIDAALFAGITNFTLTLI